ncbi:hypothetical protein [Streptomyces sp. WAC06614]|uniref:hypothetical protein n=1 Tax=Streptomyces sp. WAC06614 TaxID=2487416 RepID=UPI000F765E03|nr:hypothetical protein [Streptomyces sp. WAC06614]RSS83596.1 hypothetical protein EF918_03195 [Streptomyces sp. WAC06614]
MDDLETFLNADRATWIDLFERWHGHTYKKPPLDDVKRWNDLIKNKTYGVADDKVDELSHRLTLGFHTTVVELRNWLEKEEGEARKELAAEEKLRHEQGARTDTAQGATGVTEEQVKERLRIRAGVAIARDRSREWESEGPRGLREDMSDVTPARMEAVMTAFTTSVKPQCAEAYKHYRTEETAKLPCVVEFEAAYSELHSAEGWLREACHRMRRPLGEQQPGAALRVKQAAEEELFKAWVAYTEACSGVGAALVGLAEGFIQWAKDDTENKIRANFATEHRKTTTAMVGAKLALATTAALVGCLSLASGPAVLTALAALGVGMEYLDGLVTGAVTKADAADDSTVDRLAGRKFEGAGSEGNLDAITTTANAARQAQTVAGPGLRWLEAATGFPTAPESALVGDFAQVGKLLVDVHRIVNPQILKDTPERAALLEALHRARTSLEGAAPAGGKVDVFTFDLATGIATITVNGVRGTLQNGRFSPDDRARRSFEAALADWTRTITGPVNVPAPRGTKFGGQRVVRFTLQPVDGEGPVDAANVASSIHSHTEEELGFRCRAIASGFGLPKQWGTDRWEIEFFLSHEGDINLEEPKFEFKYMIHYPDHDQGSGIIARTGADIERLYRLRQEDSELNFIPLLRECLGGPARNFVLDASQGLLECDGSIVLEMGLAFQDVLANQKEVWDTLQRFESGVAGPDAWEERSPAVHFLLWSWEEAVRAYHDVLECGAFEVEAFRRFLTYTRSLTGESSSRFTCFVTADAELHDRLMKMMDLYWVALRGDNVDDEGAQLRVQQIRTLLESGHMPAF